MMSRNILNFATKAHYFDRRGHDHLLDIFLYDTAKKGVSVAPENCSDL